MHVHHRTSGLNPCPSRGPAIKSGRAHLHLVPREVDGRETTAGVSVPSKKPSAADASMTRLYLDVMHAAVRGRDAWGSFALIGDSLRGMGAVAILLAPIGLPCACLADAMTFAKQRWAASAAETP